MIDTMTEKAAGLIIVLFIIAFPTPILPIGFLIGYLFSDTIYTMYNYFKAK